MGDAALFVRNAAAAQVSTAKRRDLAELRERLRAGGVDWVDSRGLRLTGAVRADVERGATNDEGRAMAMVPTASRRTSCAPSSSASSAWKKKRQAIADDIKEIYAEAKGNGFDTKVLRQIVRIRKQDHAERMEQEALLELYMAALGMQPAPKDDEEASPRADRSCSWAGDRRNQFGGRSMSGGHGPAPGPRADSRRRSLIAASAWSGAGCGGRTRSRSGSRSSTQWSGWPRSRSSAQLRAPSRRRTRLRSAIATRNAGTFWGAMVKVISIRIGPL